MNKHDSTGVAGATEASALDGAERRELEALRAEVSEQKHWIEQAARVCGAAAKGDLEPRILHIQAYGDLGNLLHGINHLLDMTDAFVREAGAALTYASDGKFFRKLIETGMLGSFRRASAVINQASDSMDRGDQALQAASRERLELASTFEESISAIVAAVAAAATEMRVTAEGLTANAGTTSKEAGALGDSAGEVLNEIESIAAMVEEFSASAKEIARQVSTSTDHVSEAEREAVDTREKVDCLSAASGTIRDVLQMIQAVAEQTNLLALNATIEAARAGEAGKGFAVVAGEVKNLSGQTRVATTRIHDQVRDIQDATGSVVKAIDSICRRIHELSSVSATISSSVDEQSSVTIEMSRNASGPAAGARGMSESVKSMALAAEETTQASEQFAEAARELSELAERLQTEAADFVARVRGD